MKRKKVSILLAAILILGAISPFSMQGEKAEAKETETVVQGMEPIEGRVIVKVNPDFEKTDEKKSGVSSGDSYTMDTLLTMEEENQKSSSDEKEKMMVAQSEELSTEELVEKLEECPGVEYVEPDYAIQSFAIPNDPYYEEQWNLQRQTNETPGAANVPYVWGATEGSDEYVVAVLDSGVDYNHPDLKENMWTDADGNHGYDFSGDALTPNGDTDPMDVFGHGTHVAGIIGASGNNETGITGISQKVKIAALRILDDKGQGSTSMAIKAYEYMLEQKEKGVNFIAANNSWGGAYLSRSFQEIVDYAAEQGIVSVFASGNAGADMDANVNAPYGSNPAGTIVVNASDQYGHAADYSNYGKSSTELFAPGDRILSTEPGTVLQKEKYGIMSGTSMAAPNVTGAYALLKAYYGDGAEMSEIRARLAGGVTRTKELEELCVSGGYLNLQKAIESPYPVLDTLEQRNGQAVISGYFFGNEQGSVLMDDVTTLPIISWSDREIVVEIPEETMEGPHEFTVTTARDVTQYGKDTFMLNVSEKIVENETLFDELPSPDYEKLGVSLYDDESMMYSVESVNGKIYVTSGDLYEEREGTAYAVLLVYCPEENTWDKVSTPIPLNLEVKLTSFGNLLYVYSNKGAVFEIYSYDTEENSGFVKETEITRKEQIQKSSIATDGVTLFVVGGSKQNPADGKEIPADNVYGVNLASGECVELTPLSDARVNASVEIIDGKLTVVGGETADGTWGRKVEIFDGKTWSEGNFYPKVYENQMNMAASGVYQNQMIVSGMMSDSAHTNDTYLYNAKDGVWFRTDKNLDDEKVYFADGTVVGDNFYVFGTTNTKNSTKSRFYRLNMTTVSTVMEEPEDESKDPSTESREQDIKNTTVTQEPKNEPSLTATNTANSRITVKSVNSRTSAKTGDHMETAIWIAGLGIAGAVLLTRKKK